MSRKTNPFRPDKPVNSFDLFAGRSEELQVLVDSLFQTGNGNPRHMIISGPRGIGKSSFINQIQSLTEDSHAILRELGEDVGEFGFRFTVFKHTAMKNQSAENIITSLIHKMKEETKGDLRTRLNSILKKLKLKFKIPVVGGEIEYQSPNIQNTSEISADFVETIKNLWHAVKENKDGIVIIIDEVDTVATDTNISSFLKITTEILINSGLDRIVLYLGGITDAIDKLKKDHASIGRVFETIELSPMQPEESRQVITKTLSSGIESSQVIIAEPVTKQVVEIADGFPAIIHQLCYHAYRYDDDNKIDEDDLSKALKDVVTRIRGEELDKSLSVAGTGYARKILFVMANDGRVNVPLADIAKKLNKPTSGISSPITKLVRDEKVVRIDRGLYKIKDPLLRLYIRQLDKLEQVENLENSCQIQLKFD